MEEKKSHQNQDKWPGLKRCTIKETFPNCVLSRELLLEMDGLGVRQSSAWSPPGGLME